MVRVLKERMVLVLVRDEAQHGRGDKGGCRLGLGGRARGERKGRITLSRCRPRTAPGLDQEWDIRCNLSTDTTSRKGLVGQTSWEERVEGAGRDVPDAQD